jgi:hypothetical protein
MKLPRNDWHFERTPDPAGCDVAYGLARPVLPAAVAEPAESALWKTIAVIRSAGWYALAPFLVYAFFSIWKERDPEKRRRAAWLVLDVVLWLMIASARGGGDATDNPRYRVMFIPWMALLAAWAVDWALAHRDAWLWRWILVEVIFLSFFTNWYFSRYFPPLAAAAVLANDRLDLGPDRPGPGWRLGLGPRPRRPAAHCIQRKGLDDCSIISHHVQIR